MKTLYCFFLVLVLISTSVLGNGAVFQEGLAGAGVIPVHEDDIKLVKEYVVINQNDATVDCKFFLRNLTDKHKTINMGFPFDANYGEFKGYGRKLEMPNAFFHAYIDNSLVETTLNEAEDYDFVYTWSVDFAPSEEKLVECKYELKESNFSGDRVKVGHWRCFNYITHTGQFWSGKIDHAIFKVIFNSLVKDTPNSINLKITEQNYSGTHYSTCIEKTTFTPTEFNWDKRAKVAIIEHKNWEPIGKEDDIVFKYSKEAVYIYEYFNYKSYVGHSILYSEIDLNLPSLWDLGKIREPDNEEEEKEWKGIKVKLHKNYLRYLRNEIFARHGYVFKDQELTDFFSQCSWYQPNDSFDFDMLTKIELDNVALIKAKEKEIEESIKE